MCCIFTCCGWMIDLIQRLWTFTMSCCISSAVCCVLVTSSMSGIALGYNYSLAEYIDLKETNVSVYLKRGVFDDEIADDMDWRRSGKVPPHIQGQTNDLESGEGGPEEMPLRSGRRLEDSLVASNDQHNFEGSLMRLTAKPPDARRYNTPEPVTSDMKLEEILAKYPMGSLEMMKAVHGLMNMRNAATERHTTRTTPSTTESFEIGGRRVGNNPGDIPLSEYAPILSEMAKTLNPARVAVPDEGFRDPANWFIPKGQIPESYRRTMDLPNDDLMPDKPLTFPQPIRMSTKIFRPTRSPTSDVPVTKKMATLSDQDVVNFKYGGRDRDRSNKQPGPEGFLSESDYEEQANKGLPIRKKRNRRAAVKGYQSSHVTPTNTIFDKSDTNAMKSTRSALIDKLKSSIIKNAEELLSSTLSTTPPLETRSSKIISTIVSLH